MDFLPMPRHIQQGEGCFRIAWDTKIVLTGTQPSALLYAQLLRDAIAGFAGLKLSILRGEARPGDIALMEDHALAADAYALSVQPGSLVLRGGSDEAVLHGVMTLRQWVQRHGAALPAIEIEDSPDLPRRGYYLDCSRGRVPTLATLKQYADLLCQYKINEWQLYIEHTYLFRDLTEAWRDDTPLTAEEIMELDAYCAARHIELVPSLSSFGHMYRILSTKTLAGLCELEGSETAPLTYQGLMAHHTLNVSHPDALPFIQSLISEYMPLFRSRKFNICCDETFDLCRGRSRALAEKRSAHALYMDHVTLLCRWLLDQGVTPMFWGDIILHHPETYADIPSGVICLNWGYDPEQAEEPVRSLAQVGATQYVCPGVLSWNRWIPLYRGAFSNIRRMSRYGKRYGAAGLLNTDWGDYGHICHPWLSLPGILYGAAFAWRVDTPDFDEVNRAISFLAYGDREGLVMEALTALSGCEAFPWHSAVQWIESDTPEARRGVFPLDRVTAAAGEAIANLDAGLALLDRAALAMDARQRGLIHAAQLNARGARLFNEIGLFLAARELPHLPHRDGPALAADLERWFHAYLGEWRSVSKEGYVAYLRELMCRWADALRGKPPRHQQT